MSAAKKKKRARGRQEHGDHDRRPQNDPGIRKQAEPVVKQPSRRQMAGQLQQIGDRYLAAFRRRDYERIWTELLSSSSVTYLKLYCGLKMLADRQDLPISICVDSFKFDMLRLVEEWIELEPEVLSGVFEGMRSGMEDAGWLAISTHDAQHYSYNNSHLLLIGTRTSAKPYPLLFVEEAGNFRVDLKSVMVFGLEPDAQRLYARGRDYLKQGDEDRALYYFKATAELETSYEILKALIVNHLFVSHLVTPERRTHILEGPQYAVLARQHIADIQERMVEKLDVVALAQRGEGQTLEFKREFPKQTHDLAKEIAAFATSNPGRIYLGIEDDGTIVGLDQMEATEERDRLRARIDGVAGQSVDPPVTVHVRFIDHDGAGASKIVAVIGVPKGNEPVYYANDRPYLRAGQSSRPATSAEVKALHEAHFTAD